MERIIPHVVKFTCDPVFYVVNSCRGKVLSILVSCNNTQVFEPLSNKNTSLALSDGVILLNCIKELKNKQPTLICEFTTFEGAEAAAAKTSKVDYDFVDFTCLQVPV